MIIDITEQPASHCWVVCMDALQVNFNSLCEAQAFVGLLKARIEAPHIWPSVADLAKEPIRMPERQMARAHNKDINEQAWGFPDGHRVRN
ncbi:MULTISPECIES: hypothetical protein [unclassified Pseudomonas]|uniref:hypothetical protein n=1 Tax=unclassified Pseudomonas TaxID=196821 RepID=UPI0009EC6DBC|nr:MULTISPECIES: hypothetical protein [unclassified Pseudomonas]